jgi:hypothetical protein
LFIYYDFSFVHSCSFFHSVCFLINCEFEWLIFWTIICLIFSSIVHLFDNCLLVCVFIGSINWLFEFIVWWIYCLINQSFVPTVVQSIFDRTIYHLFLRSIESFERTIRTIELFVWSIELFIWLIKLFVWSIELIIYSIYCFIYRSFVRSTAQMFFPSIIVQYFFHHRFIVFLIKCLVSCLIDCSIGCLVDCSISCSIGCLIFDCVRTVCRCIGLTFDLCSWM